MSRPRVGGCHVGRRAGATRLAASCLALGLAAAGSVVGAAEGTADATVLATCHSAATNCFALATAPSTVTAGSLTAFSFTVTDMSPSTKIGSVEVTAPGGFEVTGASGPAKSAATTTATTATFRTLSVTPTKSAVLTVDAAAPCAPAASTWAFAVQQSTGFTGAPSSDFAIEAATAPHLGAKATGNCAVAFSGEPAGTTAASHVLTGFDSTGGPLVAAIVTPAGTLVTTYTGTVTVHLVTDPTGAALAGTTAAPVAAGVADFGNLSIGAAGVGYRLGATSPGAVGVPPAPLSSASSYFTIYAKLQSCVQKACASTAAGTKVTVVGATTAAPGGGFLGFGFGGIAAFSCGHYQFGTPIGDTANVDVLTTVGKGETSATETVTYTITKSLVKSSGREAASAWQVCYASPVPFEAGGGSASTLTLGGVTYHVGLLRVCHKHTASAPCLLARHKDNAGDEILTFLATGDPLIRP